MLNVKRRTLLQGAGYAALYGGLLGDLFQAAHAMTPAEVVGGDLDLHLLRRISFGPTAAELGRVRSMGRTAYIEDQLGRVDSDVELQALALYPRIAMNAVEIYASTGAGFTTTAHIQDLQNAALFRGIFSNAQLFEVMVDFWNDHFNTYIRKNPIPLKLDFDRRAIRANALGNFKTLFLAVVHHAEMLRYLDNYMNVSGAINENYAREIMELHTLGQGGGYTEADLKALARILSGLTYQQGAAGVSIPPTVFGDVFFNASQHDTSEKIFFGEVFAEGGGEAEINRALALLLDHPSTARYIASKLCKRFVADEPPSALVDRVAQAFTDSDGDIKAMLRTLLNADEFYASAGAKIKRPNVALIGAVRACGREFTDYLLNTDTFGVPLIGSEGQLLRMLISAGHEPFAWVPPDGYSDLNRYWANTNSLLYQQKFLVSLVEYTDYSALLADPTLLLGGDTSVGGQIANAATPREAVTNASTNLLLMALPDEAFAAALAYVAQDADPDAEMAAEELQVRVKGLVFALLASPWFFLR